MSELPWVLGAASAGWSQKARLPVLTQLQELSTGFCAAKNVINYRVETLCTRTLVHPRTLGQPGIQNTKYGFLSTVPEAAPSAARGRLGTWAGGHYSFPLTQEGACRSPAVSGEGTGLNLMTIT